MRDIDNFTILFKFEWDEIDDLISNFVDNNPDFTED